MDCSRLRLEVDVLNGLRKTEAVGLWVCQGLALRKCWGMRVVIVSQAEMQGSWLDSFGIFCCSAAKSWDFLAEMAGSVLDLLDGRLRTEA